MAMTISAHFDPSEDEEAWNKTSTSSTLLLCQGGSMGIAVTPVIVVEASLSSMMGWTCSWTMWRKTPCTGRIKIAPSRKWAWKWESYFSGKAKENVIDDSPTDYLLSVVVCLFDLGFGHYHRLAYLPTWGFHRGPLIVCREIVCMLTLTSLNEGLVKESLQTTMGLK